MKEVDVLCCGLLVADLAFSLERLPSGDEKVFADGFEMRTGGPAANAALTVRLLGGNSELIAVTDTSATGSALIQSLNEDGFDTAAIIRHEKGLNTAAVLSESSGSRQVISCKSAYIPESLPDLISEIRPAVLLFDGHLPHLSLKLMEKFPNAQTVLDAGSVHEGTELLADKVDWLITSAKYARNKSGTEDLKEALAILAELNPHTVITNGEEGCLFSIPGEFGMIPAVKVKAVDTNGAGDVFHGAFAYGLAKEMSYVNNLADSTRIASQSCMVKGIRRNY